MTSPLITAASRPDATSDARRSAPARPGNAPLHSTLTGASFLQQEPDLAKEAGLSAHDMSGWAMGGSISD